MGTIERAVNGYRHFVEERFSQHSGALLVLGGPITVILSCRLFYRCREPGARRRAAIALAVLTALSAAVVRFRLRPEGIALALLFLLFLMAALLFVANTIFGELFPINRLVGGGLLAG